MGDDKIQFACNCTACLLIGFASLVGHFNVHLSADEVSWLHGKDLRKASLDEVNGTWVETPIRALLVQLSRTKRIPIFVDRRVDPSIEITFTASGINWEQTLAKIGVEQEYGFCRLDDVYYFGPQRTAVSLPQQFNELMKWVTDNRKHSKLNWRQSASLSWARLSQPKQMFETLAKENGVAVLEQQLTFDLWPESELPNVSLLLKSALLVVGFEKWFMISRNGTRLKFIDFPNPESVQYKLSNMANSEQVVKELKDKFADIDCKTRGNTLTLIGSAESVANALRTAVQSQQVRQGNASDKSVFTAEFKGKRGSVLATIAQQLAVQLVYDRSEIEILDQHIEFAAKDATPDWIIERSLQGTGLKFRIESNQLKIYR